MDSDLTHTSATDGVQQVADSRSCDAAGARSARRGPRCLTFALALLLGVFALPCAANGAGELDPGFDADGRVLTDFGSFDEAFGVAIQADGKIVAAGERGSTDFALARYNVDGSLDTTFDGDGRVLTDFGTDLDNAFAVAIQADGKIVAAGDSGGDFALARYNPDGSLDATFDGDGRVVTDFAGRDFARSVAIQADGKIVAAGASGFIGTDPDNFALARYNLDGSLDPTFDGDGRVVTDFGDRDGAFDVAIESGGRIVAAGGRNTGAIDFALARYNPDGSLDATFDGDGRVVTDFGASDFPALGVAIQTDGQIVAAGATLAGANPSNFALARYNPDGSLDPTFDGDGRVVTDFGANDLAFGGVAIEADGKIVAAGASNAADLFGDFALARYNPDGSLDPTFDGDGMVVTGFGPQRSDRARAVAIQPDGKIVAAGESGGNFALARYLDGPANLPPDCSRVTASPNALRPANHRLRLLDLNGATDPDGDAVTLTITEVTQDEALNGPGDGNTFPDARAGSESNIVFLRAERSGKGDGRVYRVSFTGSDGKGESCSGAVTVGVPRNTGSTAIDSAPPSVNSFGP